MANESYLPQLQVADRSAIDEIVARSELDWFHVFDLDGHKTPGFPYYANWEFVAEFLKKHPTAIANQEIFEPGCADGLWTTWLTQLGAKSILATDVADRDQFRLIAKAYGLPVKYAPGIVSNLAPKTIRQQFDTVCSLGLLYHVHDPLTTLIMYRRYLKPGGYLILETATLNSSRAYMHYTGAGQIYGKEGGNQFLQSEGFLRSALNELGMDVIDYSFRSDSRQDEFGSEVGRSILVAQKNRPVEIHYYASILEQLEMLGEPFAGEAWYDWTV